MLGSLEVLISRMEWLLTFEVSIPLKLLETPLQSLLHVERRGGKYIAPLALWGWP
jgi:hypothetical protein